MKTGRYNIEHLLTSSEVEQIIIPELQRDYVWGERNVKCLLASILGNYELKREQILQIKDSCGNDIDNNIKEYLNDEYMRLRYNTRVGFIYAYHDRTLSGKYYLIDGQQRITTIFLMLLALYRRFDVGQFRKLYFALSIPEIDYQVREVAHNFLVDFIEYELTKKNDSTFKESSRYYCEYNKDITAQSIYTNYYDVIIPGLASYNNKDAAEDLIKYIENYIEFNYFDTNMSEQGEKLYLYMNSRGEALSSQERMKSIIVGRSSDKLRAGKVWEDWQNFFWRTKSQVDKNADRGFFEFLKWAAIIHMCINQDIKIKVAKEKYKSRIEEIEDYIRIEKDSSKIVEQTDWICSYISENENFSFEWLRQVETAVEILHGLLQTPEFKNWGIDRNSWFSGSKETIEYVVLLGLLYYILTIDDKNKINILRMAMYLKNMESAYTLRRNPDHAVIQCIKFVGWMARNGIIDVRLLGKYATHTKEDFNDEDVFRAEDLRWGYFQLDWQEAQNIHKQTDKIGQWESFFWKITNDKGLNRFLRGNHDFFIKVLQKAALSPDRFMALFVEKIYKHRNDDELRKSLLKYGDISIYDKGGSNNIGPNWMERWCLLASDRDESYWNKFMEGENAVNIVVSYLTGLGTNIIHDPILEGLGLNLSYMNQKYYLLSRHGQRRRVILLEDKQASKTKAKELCVQSLHCRIKNSWMWQHNFCVVSFVQTEHGLDTFVKDKNTGYYMDIWYDWNANGGRWYCRIGHRKRDLSEKLILNIQTVANKELLGIECNWKQNESTNYISLRTESPIYTEAPDEGYFKGSDFVEGFYNNMWNLLNDLSNKGIFDFEE